VAVPELECAAVLRLPASIQVQQHVQPPFQTGARVAVEVGVHLEVTAALDLVKPSTDEMGIWNEALDPGQTLEEVDERSGVQLGEHVPGGLAHRGVVVRGELSLEWAVERLPFGLLGLRELREDAVEH